VGLRAILLEGIHLSHFFLTFHAATGCDCGLLLGKVGDCYEGISPRDNFVFVIAQLFIDCRRLIL
jgi:hypothetical protein